jgi:hypothetical protein
MPKAKGIRAGYLARYVAQGYGPEFAEMKADAAMDGHRANRLTRAEREILRAVHALHISTKHTPPGNLSRSEWVRQAAFALWRPELSTLAAERAKGRK